MVLRSLGLLVCTHFIALSTGMCPSSDCFLEVHKLQLRCLVLSRVALAPTQGLVLEETPQARAAAWASCSEGLGNLQSPPVNPAWEHASRA